MGLNFNPRTPVGCDRGGAHTAIRYLYFNPRTPVGCDRRRLPGLEKTQAISIHAPQWGATTAYLRHSRIA